MKNHRYVCMAKDASFIEFEGLPGRIVSGCNRIPVYKSRYCNDHKERACCVTLKEPTEGIPPSQAENAVVEMVLGKKVTRTCTYYKVCGNSFKTCDRYCYMYNYYNDII